MKQGNSVKKKARKISVVMVMILILLTNQIGLLFAATDSFSLVDYVTTHEISSLVEFNRVLECCCSMYYEPFYVENEKSFQITVDQENETVIVTVLEESSLTRDTITARATRKYYSDSGAVAFTVSLEGRFAYTSTASTTLSASGSFSPSTYSLWTSTPTISSGNFSPALAYAKIYGTATCVMGSQNYSITLMCDNNGDITGN